MPLNAASACCCCVTLTSCLQDEWPADPEVQAQIRADFSPDDEETGDRRQELVFIGQVREGLSLVGRLTHSPHY
jgi:hypothetical protein